MSSSLPDIDISENEKQSSSNGWVYLIVVVVIILIILGLLYCFVWRPNSDVSKSRPDNYDDSKSKSGKRTDSESIWDNKNSERK